LRKQRAFFANEQNQPDNGIGDCPEKCNPLFLPSPDWPQAKIERGSFLGPRPFTVLFQKAVKNDFAVENFAAIDLVNADLDFPAQTGRGHAAKQQNTQ
jgi:hypothetical protein